jgi:DNA mismatch repair protein MutS
VLSLIFAGMSKKTGDTPLMQQHQAIKQKYPDAILLFRVGDFYETFGEDAVHAARVLGITLTKRNNGDAESSALAGFPHHALDTYLHKLVKAGYRVAICDQLEDPKLAKGIVKRGVTELVTPGVATSDKLLENNRNNFLAALHFNNDSYGAAFLDISTGEFFAAEGNSEYIDKLLQTLQPAEILLAKQESKNFKEVFGLGYHTYLMETWLFENAYCTDVLLKHFQTQSLKGFGIEDLVNASIAAGAVIHYLKDTEHPNLQHISTIQRIERGDHLWMDRFTIRNLEILFSPCEQGLTLLKVLDQTATPMGARLLKRWLVMPLIEKQKIEDRLDAVAFFIMETDCKKDFIHAFKNCGDIERLVSKIPNRKLNPRDMLLIATGLQQVQTLKETASGIGQDYIKRLTETLHPCTSIAEKILQTLTELPPVAIQKGNGIRPGVHAELDSLRNIASKGKGYLMELQQKEALATGINSLKISFNNVFGYYLEVTNIHKNKVPGSWIRKQTLTNAERYITPELKEYEEKILGAEEKIIKIETDLFEALITELSDFIAPIQTNGNILAILDCLVCFANNALQYDYHRPVISEERDFEITGSRHPVIERHLPAGESYITNDIALNDTQQVIILTGPNMSGKSALLRQTALITLMAHCGSFVPAVKAVIPLTDKIFTRVGASDNLSGGESTFMVEMNETASIINNLSSRSLILLDEIGRGTSTYDGISIAWSIVEFLQQSTEKPKTLFATHYHELNELENLYEGIRNYHITNKEVGGKIIFLRKLAPGGSTHSFGIHVAKMAGMPLKLINRANEVLQQLEQKHIEEHQSETFKNILPPKMQLSIFDTHSQTFDEIRTALNNADINRLTPVEALLKLQEIKGMVK